MPLGTAVQILCKSQIDSELKRSIAEQLYCEHEASERRIAEIMEQLNTQKSLEQKAA